MLSLLRQFIRAVTACFLIAMFAVPSNVWGQAHVVSPTDLQRATVAATQVRQKNLETVTRFVSSPAAEKALRSAHMDPAQVKTGVSALGDQELAKLAARADKAQKDFAAGTLTDRDLIIILVAIAALILIIVAVR